jgi:hypothetical protein
MNTVDAGTAIAGQYTYVRIYTYIMLFDTYAVYIYYVCMSVKKAFVGTTKSTLHLRSSLSNTARNTLHINTKFLK